MEEIVSKLQKLSIHNVGASFDETLQNMERQQFDEFLESCSELCQLISQAGGDSLRIIQNLDTINILVD